MITGRSRLFANGSRRKSLIVVLLAGSFVAFSACSSSQSEEELGTIRGTVDRVLHHGVPPEEGEDAAETTTPMEGLLVYARATSGERTDSTQTDRMGRFELRLPPGGWVVSTVRGEPDPVPATPPDPQTVLVTADSAILLQLRYHIYAP